MSEYYALRRTSIKDVTAFCAFVIGFFGSAPLAWPYLSSQAENGDFALGVGVFFLVIATGAVISGGAGLLVGAGIGWTWEQIHRFRRRRTAARSGGRVDADDPPASPVPSKPGGARPLQLTGRTLDAVTYRATGLELAFGPTRVRAPLDLALTTGGAEFRLPEAKARDLLHSLIGETVQQVSESAGGTVELYFANGAAIRRLSMTSVPQSAVTAGA